MKMRAPGKKSFTQTEASAVLDLLRGLAAVFVFAGHWRNIFFVDYPQLPHALRLPLLLPYLLTSGGHQAVVVFFVLSGYFITSSVLRSFQSGTWSWAAYLTHRLVRLWIVLLPGLLLCAFWDKLGIALNRAPLLYGGANYNHVTGNVPSTLNVPTFFGNLFFVQGVLTRVFGSDGALWSLANEFWYYLLFPLLCLSLRRKTRRAERIFCIAAFCAMAWWLRSSLLPSFPIWLLGSLLAVAPVPRDLSWLRWLAAAILCFSLAGTAKFSPLQGIASDYAFGIITALCAWCFLSAQKVANPKSLWTHLSRAFARPSFTLYVVHLPLVTFMASVLLHDTRWIPDARHLAAGLALFVLTSGYAWFVAFGTEFHTDSLRRWVERTLGLRSHPRQDVHEAALRQ
jgi:peptidoglycan/LPS O-acetylase OafA/YrhL